MSTRLAARAAAPGLDSHGWHPLPPLPAARQELLASRLRLQRLAHALGGSLPWFRATAWPVLLRWESLVAGLPAAPGREACTSSDDTGQVACTALDQLLGSAARAAEQAGARQAAQRLLLAERAALEQARWAARSWWLEDARGERWTPDRQGCRQWRAQASAPLRCRPVLAPAHRHALALALASLGARGIWRDDGHGRWLASRQGWTLLWPLAARDLLAMLQGPGHADAAAAAHTPVPAAAEDAVREQLHAAGWLPDAARVLRARRLDGRLLAVLPVLSALRRQCGLGAALPAQVQVQLLGPLAAAGSAQVVRTC